MNKSIRNIKESLFRELMDLQVFWSYKKPDLYTLSDEILIEKVLLHSDLDILEDYLLVGGTALSIQINHRLS